MFVLENRRCQWCKTRGKNLGSSPNLHPFYSWTKKTSWPTTQKCSFRAGEGVQPRGKSGARLSEHHQEPANKERRRGEPGGGRPGWHNNDNLASVLLAGHLENGRIVKECDGSGARYRNIDGCASLPPSMHASRIFSSGLARRDKVRWQL